MKQLVSNDLYQNDEYRRLLFDCFITFLDFSTLTALVDALDRGDKIFFQATSTTIRVHRFFSAIKYPLQEERAECDAADRKRRRLRDGPPPAPRKPCQRESDAVTQEATPSPCKRRLFY